MRLCQDEKQYRAIERGGILRDVIGAYAIGRRSSGILDTLAIARVLADNIGEWLPLPKGYDRSTWQDITGHLVLKRLGNRRCLDCRWFFSDQRPGGTCFVGLGDRRITVPFCPRCDSVATEVIGCTEGMVA